MELDPKVIGQLKEVGGDSLLEELYSLFLTNAPLRMERLRQGLAKGEMILVEKAAHSLRSSCATLGARELAAQAAKLEVLAADGDRDAIAAFLPGLERQLERLLGSLRTRTPGVEL